MKYSVRIEAWISVEAPNEEEACKKGMEMLGRGLSLIEEDGGEWAMLEPENLDEEEVPWGA